MRALITLVLLLATAALGLAIAVPDKFEVERAVSIDASPRKIYPFISDLHRWAKWSPWDEKGSGVKQTYTGARSGRGAVYEWVGSEQALRGRMELTATTPPAKVVAKLKLVRPFEIQTLKLDFVPPLEIVGTTDYSIVVRGGSTVVTWTLHGKYSMLDKLKGLAATMELVLGRELDVGLARLKVAAEG